MHKLSATLALSTSILLNPIYGHTTIPTQEIPLWSQSFLTSQQMNKSLKEQADDKGHVTQVTNPRMQLYLPQHSNHKAILVMSGGGYIREDLAKEGKPVSQWLANQGFTVFNLIYRLPDEGWLNKQVAFADGQRAMRLIRQKAKDYDYQQVGIMGFSAGGHLAGMLAVLPNQNYYSPQDEIDKNSAKPDFVALLYPIVSMLPEKNHTHSYKTLLGKQATEAEEIALSVEQWVTPQTPPMFIAHAKDDPIANVDKSILLDKKLRQAGVKENLTLFENGGHGWGMGKKGTSTPDWKNLFLKWVNQI